MGRMGGGGYGGRGRVRGVDGESDGGGDGYGDNRDKSTRPMAEGGGSD